LEIGKSLVEVQIENTKLLEKLQNKDYENGKRIMQTENRLAKKELGHQESLDKLAELNLSLSEALEAKRDLEVEFIALKRNFITQQKDLKALKEDNQHLSLDLINLGNDNERLRMDFMKDSRPDGRSRVMLELAEEKQSQLQRDNKRLEDTVDYLKGELERYKKELLDKEVSFQRQTRDSGLSGYGKDYDRIELENHNAELANHIKLLQRKVEELEDKLGFFEEENNGLEAANRELRAANVAEVNDHRNKLQELARGSSRLGFMQSSRPSSGNFGKTSQRKTGKVSNATTPSGRQTATRAARSPVSRPTCARCSRSCRNGLPRVWNSPPYASSRLSTSTIQPTSTNSQISESRTCALKKK
jgi:coiled-coil domain-containing protein 78